MKRIFTLALFFCFAFQAYAQTDGLTYQAVIIGPEELELPGVNSPDNYLPETTINMRFSIIDGNNAQNPPEFQEIRMTETDEFGRVNLIIGKDNDAFKSISWDGGTKLLKVEIDFEGGSDFTLISVEELTYLPYAAHRNITASGTLTVDDRTFLNGELEVAGPTNLNSSLNVADGNPTDLSGNLTVDGDTNLNSSFTVNNQSPTDLTGTLRVGGNSNLEGTFDVLGATTLQNTLDVTGDTTLGNLTVNGLASFGDLNADDLTVNLSTSLTGSVNIQSLTNQVRITSEVNGSDLNINNYPVLIEGGNQGLAIVVNQPRQNRNNFVSFWDTTTTVGQTPSGVTLPNETPTMWGRIEGEIPSEFGNDADYEFDQSSLDYDIYDAGFDVAFAAYDLAASFVEVTTAATSSTACVGLGTCVTVPIPSWIVSSTAQSVAAGLQLIAAGVGVGISLSNKDDYDDNKETFRGVTYASGAGDYAEYLLKENKNEAISFGDVVGLKGGKISKNTTNAERVMVISRKPIVLGNMPDAKRESEYEKVAFMGQVPVKVYGKVNIGDYIIPSGKNDGIGISISKEKITSKNVNKIIGVAWEESQQTFDFDFVNVAIGLNKNDNNLIIQELENKIEKQSEEINDLKNQISVILESLSKIENGENVEEIHSEPHKSNHVKYEVVESTENDIIYFQITRDDFEKGLAMAEDMIRSSGEYERYEEHLEKLKNDSAFKEKFFNKLQADLKHRLHYHKQTDRVGRN